MTRAKKTEDVVGSADETTEPIVEKKSKKIEKQYIGGKEIISSVEEGNFKRIIDIDGTTYLEPIE